MKQTGAILLILFFGFSACQESPEQVALQHPEGQALAERFCQSCHLFPQPSELPQSTWRNDVLPKMGSRLGLLTAKVEEIDNLKTYGLFPDTSALSREEWLKILDFYIDNAPLFDKSYEQGQELRKLSLFEIKEKNFPVQAPFSSLLFWDEPQKRLFYGNDANNSLLLWSNSKVLSSSKPLAGAPSSLFPGKKGYWVLSMGKVMPHNDPIGSLSFLALSQKGQLDSVQVLIEGLERPVHAAYSDLNQDGNLDVVISNFGNYKGELLWYSNFQSAESVKNTLRAAPGAIKSAIVDLNKDGKPDILALMAQGDEGFFYYENQGQGKFAERYLLRFPATYGSTYFELLDFNADGLQDILYVNGDNGDYYPIRKDYHGIRLFLNKGNLEFEESFFLPHHGAFKAKAHDFDQDGDLDLAAISYFPDYKSRPEEGFVYYENKGRNRFIPQSLVNSPYGKWLTMETGDFDQDGDIDIVLGSALYMQVEVPKDLKELRQKQDSPILFLENQLSK